jgi:gas vesicle protein GvpN
METKPVPTILRASPRRFVSTPAVERVAMRALRYLQSGFSVHLRGPAGTGKTTLALHLADLLTRPIMLLFGDDEFKTSDLIGNQSGYTRKKVVDNFIHSVVKVEDELRQNWVDSRLTLACREGFTLVYDEFNRSRPEVNNVLLSALEEKLLVLPPSHGRSDYIRVHPQFRAIFTSNPEEYCGVHATQDALLDRLITIDMPEPDEQTQQEIIVQKTNLDRDSAALIVQLVRAFREKTGAEKSSGLRSSLIVAKVCQEHSILVIPENPDFHEICQDVLLSRSGLSVEEASRLLWEVFNEQIAAQTIQQEVAGFVPHSRIIPRLQKAQMPRPDKFEAIDELELDTESDSLSELITVSDLESTNSQSNLESNLEAGDRSSDSERYQLERTDRSLNLQSSGEAPNPLTNSVQESLIQLLEQSELSEDDVL